MPVQRFRHVLGDVLRGRVNQFDMGRIPLGFDEIPNLLISIVLQLRFAAVVIEGYGGLRHAVQKNIVDAGLGAEIKDSQEWQEKFIGKKIFDDNGNVVLSVVKKVDDPETQVDCVTGATLTSNGVDAMLKECLKNIKPTAQSCCAAEQTDSCCAEGEKKDCCSETKAKEE